MVVGIPESDVQEAILDPASVMDMNGVQAMPCGVSIMDRDLALNQLCAEPAYLVTDLEDFAVDVHTIGQLKVAEAILSARARAESDPH
jgi:GTP:adenosylcobinamide-phosphate guanylyltransferase